MLIYAFLPCVAEFIVRILSLRQPKRESASGAGDLTFVAASPVFNCIPLRISAKSAGACEG
eukprot:m.95201 g.95201  ORF g.95201 m.95201 type:complete len:61 (+) comp21903_c0_seq2:229-411(+)